VENVPPLRRLALPFLLAAASVAVAGPASAEVTGSTSTSDVVLYNQCQQHDISYEVQPSPGTTYWRLEIQVFNPVGATSQGSVLISATSPRSGTVAVQFCGSERTGTWTVRGSGSWQVTPGVNIPFRLPDTAFQVRPAATRTSLSPQALVDGRSRLSIGVREQSPRGWSRADGIPVRLERAVDGGWQRVRGNVLTAVHGTAVATVASPGTYRAVVRAHGNYGASESQPVRLGG
jgi:hypothetical protein